MFFRIESFCLRILYSIVLQTIILTVISTYSSFVTILATIIMAHAILRIFIVFWGIIRRTLAMTMMLVIICRLRLIRTVTAMIMALLLCVGILLLWLWHALVLRPILLFWFCRLWFCISIELLLLPRTFNCKQLLLIEERYVLNWKQLKFYLYGELLIVQE